MTEEDRTNKGQGGQKADEDAEPVLRAEEQSIRSLLRDGRVSARTPPVSLLRGVQRKIRQRSRGRFYADGWSTSGATTSTYVVTSLLMLGILLIVYFILLPALPAP